MSATAEPRFLDVDGIRVHCIVAGRGEPVVLLHGLGASHIAWRDNIGPLSQRYTVYALDLPGHGDSAKPPLTYALPEGSSFLSSLLDTLRLDKAHLVGNSLGGMIALQFALDHPERVAKLVLADPAGLGRKVVLFVRLSSLPLLGELLEWPTLFGTRALLKVVFYDQRFGTDDLVQELLRARATPGAKQAVLKAIRWGVNPWGLRSRAVLLSRLPELGVPVLLVWGARDRVLPVAQAHEAARLLPSARLHIFEECGHWPQMEKATQFNELLLEFLPASPL